MSDKKNVKGRIKKSTSESPPARTAEAREKQLINMAMDLAEDQLRKGVATSQVITHFLKLGTEAEKLAREKVENENALLKAKVEQIASQERTEELYKKALKAMINYTGSEEEVVDFDDDEIL